MARPKKDGKVLNMKLNMATYENLEQYCEESGLTKTRAVERILNKYFDNYFERPETERNM